MYATPYSSVNFTNEAGRYIGEMTFARTRRLFSTFPLKDADPYSYSSHDTKSNLSRKIGEVLRELDMLL